MTTTRRQFIKQTGSIGALAAATGAAANEAASTSTDGPAITMAGYDYDRVAALAKGKVQVEGFTTTFEKDRIGNLNTHLFNGPGTRDVSEVGIHPFMLAYANDGFRDYTLLPIFPLRTFRHKSIFIRTDRGITKPEDLKGRKVATPGFSSSSLTWLRGILQHEHGVNPEDIEWYISDKDSSASVSGSVSKQENVIPIGLNVRNGPKGKDESEMLADGDVDALLHAIEPKCYLEGDPKVARLFGDFRRAEQAYFKKTGIFPIMHAVAVRKKSLEKHPELPNALFKAYCASKQIAYKQINEMAWAYNSLPWLAQEMEDTRKLMGDNYWPYGIEPNRKTLEAIFQYSHEQGLAKKLLTIEELFHPAALELTES
ncbi:ABC transporter substrate-binding protein [Haloferula sp.]|uniref:ABC transporter substrate-binding protein n=1 Tax=Haloferula sp. TaxID=2497595 RepID=UPI00329B890D